MVLFADVMKSDEDHSTSISEPLHMDNQQPSTVPDNHGNNQPSSSQQLQLRTDCRTVALHHLEHESTDSYTFQALQPQHTVSAPPVPTPTQSCSDMRHFPPSRVINSVGHLLKLGPTLPTQNQM